jgi:hypothetical protein
VPESSRQAVFGISIKIFEKPIICNTLKLSKCFQQELLYSIFGLKLVEIK